MIFIKVFCLFFLMLFFSACSPPLTQKRVIINELSTQFIKTINKNEGLKILARGGESMGQVKLFVFDTAYPHPVNTDQARSINVRCINLFMNMVNNNIHIRPFLDTYPYSVNGLNLVITFDPNDSQSDQNIHETYFMDGYITYRIYDKVQKKGVIIFKETYAEALQRADSCAETG